MSQADAKETSWPERAAIALFAIPVALFFGAWYQPLVGLPASALVVWVAWNLGKSVSSSPLPSRRALLMMAAVAVGWTWLAGIGGFFQQMPDQNFRNALLHDLIDRDWPVVWNSAEGLVALDYYLAWSLLPALVGKWFGWKVATYAMAVLCSFGVFLVFLLFARVVGSWRAWLPVLFMLWSGLDILGWALRTRFSFAGMMYIDTWCYPPLWYLSHLMNFLCVPHLSIPTWLITLLVVGRRWRPGHVLAGASFLFPLAPYQMLGLLPFAIWGLLQGDGPWRDRVRAWITTENILFPAVVLAMCAPLYLGNTGAGMGAGWFFENSPSSLPPWVVFLSFVGVEVLVYGAAIWFCGIRNGLLLLALVVLCIIPLRQSGLSNDLALKASMPGLAILTVFTAKAWMAAKRPWAHWLLITVFTLGAVTPLHEIWVAAGWTLADPYSLEEDFIRTFDPANDPNHSYGKFVVNFRSRPLQELPLLRWMLGVRTGT